MMLVIFLVSVILSVVPIRDTKWLLMMAAGDTFQDMERNNSHHEMDINQRTTTYISICYEDQRWCFESVQHVGIVKTSKLPAKDVHPSVQPAPDPLKIHLHLSPLGRESTSTHISKFSFDLYSDAVD
jgi:hypothetical protein